MSLTDTIRKHTLKNAFDYGKANPGNIAGKVIADVADAKKDMKTTMQEIAKEVARVNALSKEQIENELKNYSFEEKKVEAKKVFDLPGAVYGKVITRFPPEPSGYPHIGHAKAAWLDYEAARENGGQLILRFDDTNPEKESQEYVQAIKEGLKWLGIPWAKETYSSDNFPKIYEAAEILIKKGKAYVSEAPQEVISEMRTGNGLVKEREESAEKNLARFEEMKKGKKYVLLYKGNLAAENTVMRDPSLGRVITASHYRQKEKYVLWPGYDLAVVVMDHLEGITHSMRSKEYELRDELYRSLCKDLGYACPELIGFSRLAIKNAPISKRLLTPLVKEGKVTGWDDPRLPTLSGLKRRGITPEAIKQFVLSFGLSKVESEPGWDALLTETRKQLDPVSPHFFFVANPVHVVVEGLENQTIHLKKHPKAALGDRTVMVTKELHISKSDANDLKVGETIRLKDLCNIQIISIGDSIHAKKVEDGMVPKKIQWVSHSAIKTEVWIPHDLFEGDQFKEDSLEIVHGLAESAVLDPALVRNGAVQFERFGFCRFDFLDPLKGTARFIFIC